MTRIVFTGPEGLHARVEAYVRLVIIRDLQQYEPTEFISGCAVGLDTLAAETALEAYPGVVHRFVVPQGRHNEHLVSRMEDRIAAGETNIIVQRIMDTPRSQNPHLYRNVVMIKRGELLAAMPESPLELQRSGTWHTIRRARDKGMPIHFFPLTEIYEPWTENL